MLVSNTGHEIAIRGWLKCAVLIALAAGCNRAELRRGTGQGNGDILGAVASSIRQRYGDEKIGLRSVMYCLAPANCEAFGTNEVWPDSTLNRLAEGTKATQILRQTFAESRWGPMDSVTLVLTLGPPVLITPDSAAVNALFFECPGFWRTRYVVRRVQTIWTVVDDRPTDGGDASTSTRCGS